MKNIVLTAFLVLIASQMNAQTYENTALKEEAEAQIAVKNGSIKVPNHQENDGSNTLILKALDLNDSYKLVDIQAIDYAQKHTKEEMILFQNEMLDEYETNDIIIAEHFTKLYIINRENQAKYLSRDIKKQHGKIAYVDCDKCDMDAMTIVQDDHKILILETPAQDLGSFYTVRLTFKK